MTTIIAMPIKIFILIVLIKLIENVDGRRGPHHPRGQEAQLHPPKLDEHADHEREHLRDDLGPWAAADTKLLSEMTNDEKNFYYFKVHDADHNDVLDGLEMLQAATHRSGHLHHHEKDDGDLDSGIGVDNELDRIIEVIDDFLNFADLNHDGYLNYPEYIKAIQNEESTNEL